MNDSFWKGKSVFITGHTGFKGGWLAHWLYELGAYVYGYSLEPLTRPNFFTETHLSKRISQSIIGDVRDISALSDAIHAAQPEIIIHLAAQSLVRMSYSTPVETFAVNVLGTVNVLEAARKVGTVKAIVNITTDKCYVNNEWVWPYRENDRLGGHDPYAASKACAEIVAAAYRASFLDNCNIHLASVRAGNVIGGGDWATDRLIPDFFRAFDAGKTLAIRSPNAVRPWQHVLEPLYGYLLLAEKLYTKGREFAEAWNFGANYEDSKPVSCIVDMLCARMPGARWKTGSTLKVHEAGLLTLDSSKAKTQLGWVPRWDLGATLDKTIEWHQAWRNKADMAMITSSQIQAYIKP
ncbi:MULTISPECIES: CDP-glucose 4,6-dehydratase [unclassified Roseobacter]|uniref:CDP-glucose 4,6-dehydratase n=1 Tax=unclassified Roseobacter TaxID=196798 RepID=UPI0030ED1B92